MDERACKQVKHAKYGVGRIVSVFQIWACPPGDLDLLTPAFVSYSDLFTILPSSDQ